MTRQSEETTAIVESKARKWIIASLTTLGGVGLIASLAVMLHGIGERPTLPVATSTLSPVSSPTAEIVVPTVSPATVTPEGLSCMEKLVVARDALIAQTYGGYPVMPLGGDCEPKSARLIPQKPVKFICQGRGTVSFAVPPIADSDAKMCGLNRIVYDSQDVQMFKLKVVGDSSCSQFESSPARMQSLDLLKGGCTIEVSLK